MNLGRKISLRERRKIRRSDGVAADSQNRHKVRGRLITFILWPTVAILFIATVVQFSFIWQRYGVYFGPGSVAQQFVDRNLISYELDTHDSLFALKRLQVACLRYEIKDISLEEFSAQRRQVRAMFPHFEGDTLIAKEVSRYESYRPAMDQVKLFLDISQKYEEGNATIGDVLLVSEDAVDAWMRLTTDTIGTEFKMRDSMKVAFEDFGQLAKQAALVVSVLSGLTMLSLIVLAYVNRVNAHRARNRFRTFETLVASVGHDLRSPLQTIQSAISLLRGNLSEADREHYSAMAKSATKSLSRLVTDILQITRGEPLTTELQNVNIEKWFHNFVTLYEDKARSKGLEFQTHIDVNAMRLSLDPDRLTQCIGNLVDNAIRYTKTGKIGVTLTIRDQARKGYDKALVIKVKDTGVGIAAADLSRIFLPFERATDIEARQGMGLGLSIVQKMAQGSGGSIDVESELGVGSVFTFVLPVQEVPSISVPWVDGQTIPHSLKSDTPEILVVDDDLGICSTVAGTLREAGFSVDTATNGSDALKLAHSTAYQIILTDIQMPGLNGFDLAKECKDLESAPYIIAMTAYTSNLQQDDRAACFDAVLAKAFTTEALLQVIERAVDARST